MSTHNPIHSASRLGGLDGLRALAVILVILYHSELTHRPQAGFLGVDVFFVLSGFLITTLLLRERVSAGAVNLRSFYLRRTRRLFPALLAVMGASALAGLTIAPDALDQLRRNIPAALAYVSNWSQIDCGQTYFESVGRPPLLQHLWSLAIEEQFYVLWPALLIIAMRVGGRRLALTLAASIGIATTAWMAWLSVRHDYPVGNDPTRVYFGTDTHSMGLFVGAALAALLAHQSPASYPTAWRRCLVTLVGGAATVAIVTAAILVPENSEPLYRGGFLAFSVIAALLVWAVIQPGTLPGRIAETPVLAAIGRRSYGLYLWHWPVFQVLRPGLDIELRGLAAFAVQILATALLAELSYRCIEMPLRSARVPVVDPSAAAKLMVWTPRVALVGALVALVALFTDQPATFAPGALTAGAEKAPTLDSPSENSTTATITEAAPTAAVASSVEPDPAVDASRPESRDVSAFGDSVILGAGNKLHQMMGAVDIDAEVGRQAEALVRRVSERAAAHELAKSVVVHIGTNGFVAERQLRALLDTLRDRDTVVLVNAHAPRRWVIPNNELIARVAPDYPNVRVVDWYHLAQAHPEYFVRDDIHLTGPGLRVFSGAIQAAAAVEPPESLLVARR
jgi:peptidoglycan/LPS O-acetylase OafA/YrhL